jgi:hypothetical protein
MIQANFLNARLLITTIILWVIALYILLNYWILLRDD